MGGETALIRDIRLDAYAAGVVLHRNNVGMLTDERGNKVRYGLCVGSADLIGWTRNDGRFVAIEVKAPGWKPPKSGKAVKRWIEQMAFLAAVRGAGGIAGVARSLDEFRRIIAGG